MGLFEDALSKGGKKGEGARGGHVIGHTKAGNPIYAPKYHSSTHSKDWHKRKAAKFKDDAKRKRADHEVFARTDKHGHDTKMLEATAKHYEARAAHHKAHAEGKHEEGDKHYAASERHQEAAEKHMERWVASRKGK